MLSNLLLFSLLYVLDTETKPQIKVQSLFLRRFFGIKHELFRNSLDGNGSKSFENHFSEQDSVPFFIKDENFHPKNLDLTQKQFQLNPQLYYIPALVTQTIAAKRLNDQFTAKILSTQERFFEKTFVNLSKRKLETSIQSKFLPKSVASNLNTINTEILKETIASAVLTEKEPPISITRKHDKKLPMSVPAKTCRSNTPPEKSTSANNLLDTTGHQVSLQNTAI